MDVTTKLVMVRPNLGKETKVEANLISLLRSIKSTLIDLQENDLKSITKCWNCFKDISPVDNVCAYCGKRQD